MTLTSDPPSTVDNDKLSIRLKKLRKKLKRLKIDVFLLPVADAFQGFPLAEHDRRVEWLTGFSGSTGICAVAHKAAVMFVDSRYTIQAASEVCNKEFEIRALNNSEIRTWLRSISKKGGTVGIDPWLHSDNSVESLRNDLAGWDIVAIKNPVDKIWKDQPKPPDSAMIVHKLKYAGQSRKDKIKELAKFLKNQKVDSIVLTNSDTIAWLLNVRGSDIANNPIKHAYASVCKNGNVRLFVDLPISSRYRHERLGSRVVTFPLYLFKSFLSYQEGRVFVPDSTIHGCVRKLRKSRVEICRGPDPCELRKMQKNDIQLQGFTQAHVRDGVAMTEFLAWLDTTVKETKVNEIAAAAKLLEFRRQSGFLYDESFDTISAAGQNGAIVHYRASKSTCRQLSAGDLYLVDSGGQYQDGTTDVTRTVPIGEPTTFHKKVYTLVLNGLIDLTNMCWPTNTPNSQLDAIARQHLWREQLDYAHSTGHGVGHFLAVHEVPPTISTQSLIAIKPRMVLSIEPGCYLQGQFGVRLENLAVVQQCAPAFSKQKQEFLQFSTLTLVPFDRRLIDVGLMTNGQREWLNCYHATVLSTLADYCSPSAVDWLRSVCEPIS